MTFFDGDFLRIVQSLARAAEEFRPNLEMVAKHAREVERTLSASRMALDVFERYRGLDSGMVGLAEELARSPVLRLPALADDVSRFIDQIVLPNQAALDHIRLSATNVAALSAPFSLGDSLSEILARFNSLQTDQGLSKEEAETALVDQTRARVQVVPLTALTAQFYLSILFALMLFLIQQHSAVKSDEVRRAEHAQIEELISDAIEALELASSGELVTRQYLVGRPVTVRHRPSPRKGRAITILYPGHRVVIGGRRGKWARIEFYDGGAGEVSYGWVLKKHLIKLPE